jgi:DNA-binding NarL/FixJ family response regulator
MLDAIEANYLRALAIEEDRSAADAPDVLGALWSQLASGRLIAVDHFHCDGRSSIILKLRIPAADPRPPRPRNVAILKRILLGEAQKVIALEASIAPSTVAVAAAHCARSMGFGKAASIPTLLVLAAHAHDGLGHGWGRSTGFLSEGNDYHVVSAAQPVCAQVSALTEAERAIVALLVERRSNAEIARIRQVSIRTVANQIASAFRKLKVHARLEALCRLIDTRRGTNAVATASPSGQGHPADIITAA